MATPEKIKKFIPRHLEDKPSAEDKFGGHEKIAIAVKEIIDNAPIEKDVYQRKPIGLLGGWGSGKSSVIKNLDKLYNQDEEPSKRETLIFEFDAWVYENDPIRRSFLEAFLVFLEKKEKTNVSDWEDDLNRIRRQKETHITESTPLLTETGRSFGFSLMMFSIGLAMLSNPINSNFHFLILFSFLLGPFIVVLGASFKKWLKKRKGETCKDEDGDPISLFFNKTKDTVLNNIVKTPDPTAIEFQKIFTKILDKCLSNDKARLIIVVDNLDRLPEEKALALWATMRSFFIDRDGNNACFKNLWLIVPLDPISLKDIFSNDAHNNDIINAKVKSYLEKTFEITFRVAPPVLSDWEDFLVEKGQEAFDDAIISEEQWKTIARIYEVYLQEDNKEHLRETVTPRKIISLINSISSLYRLWQFPPEVIALYCIFKDRIEPNIYGLVTPEQYLPSTAISIANEPKWQEYIAALYFNTEPHKAIQILIADKLVSAFKRGGINQAEKQIQVPGGEFVAEKLARTYSPIWARTEPHYLFNMAYVLGGLLENDFEIGDRFWRPILNETATIESWQTFTEESAPGVLTLLHCIENNAAQIAAINIVNSLQNVSDANILSDKKISKIWFDIFTGAEGYIDETDASNKTIINLDLPANVHFRVNILLNTDKNTRNRILECFLAKPGEHKNQKVFENEMSGEIANRISSGGCEDMIVGAANNMLRASADWDFGPIAAAIEGQLRERKETLNSFEIFNVISIYGSEKQRSDILVIYNKLCKQGVIFDHLHLTATKEPQPDLSASALCVIGTLKFNASGVLESHHHNSAEGLKRYNEILSNLENHGELVTEIAKRILPLFTVKELVDLHRDQANAKPLITACLNKILDEKGKNIKISPTDIIASYKTYLEAFGVEGTKNLILALAQEKDFFETLENAEFTGQPLAFHLILAEEPNDIGGKYRAYASSELNKLDAEQWIQSLKTQDEKLRIAIALKKAGKALEFGAVFRESLEKHVEGVYDGEIEIQSQQNWKETSSCLSSANEKTFFKNIRDMLINKRLSDHFYKVFDLFGPLLFDKGEFDEKAKADEVVRHLFMPMLASDQGIEFIKAHSQAVASVFKNSSKETQTSFIEDMRKNISDHFGQDKAKIYVKIATLLGLKKVASLYDELEQKKKNQEGESDQIKSAE